VTCLCHKGLIWSALHCWLASGHARNLTGGQEGRQAAAFGGREFVRFGGNRARETLGRPRAGSVSLSTHAAAVASSSRSQSSGERRPCIDGASRYRYQTGTAPMKREGTRAH